MTDGRSPDTDRCRAWGRSASAAAPCRPLLQSRASAASRWMTSAACGLGGTWPSRHEAVVDRQIRGLAGRGPCGFLGYGILRVSPRIPGLSNSHAFTCITQGFPVIHRGPARCRAPGSCPAGAGSGRRPGSGGRSSSGNPHSPGTPRPRAPTTGPCRSPVTSRAVMSCPRPGQVLQLDPRVAQDVEVPGPDVWQSRPVRRRRRRCRCAPPHQRGLADLSPLFAPRSGQEDHGGLAVPSVPPGALVELDLIPYELLRARLVLTLQQQCPSLAALSLGCGSA
ncbi:hypothetical protein SANTM175S_05516 [Streptomyces antimycoticus]